MKTETKWAIFFTVLSIAIIILCGLAPPYFEMRTFNKYRGDKPEATYIDALFSELRIEAGQ